MNGQTEFTIGFVVVCFGLGYALVILAMKFLGKKQSPSRATDYPLSTAWLDQDSSKEKGGSAAATAFALPAPEISETEQHHREVLGVAWNAGEMEITRAYMQLRAKYDPTKVSHLGEEFHALAVARTREAMEAYEYLKERLNFR